MLDLDELDRSWREAGMYGITTEEITKLLALARAGRRHYEEHMDCNEDCTCEEFVREWREADGG